MRSRYKIALGIITILILLTITVGTSYSYYSVSDTQETPNSLATACFQFTFNEETQSGISGPINLTNAYPMTDEKGGTTTPYKFTIKNTCESGTTINYKLTLDSLTTPASTLNANLIKYKLDKTNGTAQPGTATMLNTKLSDNALDAITKSTYNIQNVYNLEEGTLAPNETKTYDLRLWLDSSATNDTMGQSFTGMVLVYATM